MDPTFTTPHWLTKARETIENSKEWRCFTAELFQVMQQQQHLAQSSVTVFSELSETERALLLERAAKATHGGSSRVDVVTRVSSVLEDVLSGQVAIEVKERHAVSPKTDLFQSHVRDGVVSLLNKWPDMKSKLTVLFNHPLPTAIREVAWKLCLSNTKARMDYLTAVSVNKARSRLDRDVGLQCDSLFTAGSRFPTLGSIAVKVLKRVLSYYHRTQNLKDTLPESDCLLLVPLLQVALASSTPSTSSDSLVTGLVEQYLSFMGSRPAAMKPGKPGAATGTESGDVFGEVASMLDQKDKELACVVRGLHTPQGGQVKQSLLKGVMEILQPVLEVLFVGYLDTPALLYVWDQYIVGLDSPSYDCLPAFACAFLLLLRDHLLPCGTSSEMAEVMRCQGPALSVPQLQSVISMHFYDDLFTQLTRDKAEGFPVLDPTQAFFPPWTHLLTSKLPVRTKPRDRRQAREMRETQRLAEAENKIREAQHQKLEEEEEIRRAELKMQRELEEARREGREQRVHLEEQLAQERQHHYDVQKTAEEQINQLQAEVRKIRELKLLVYDTDTEGSFGTPPPSMASQTDERDSYPAPPEHHGTPPPSSGRDCREMDPPTTDKTVEAVAEDLLQRLIQCAGSVIHGENVMKMMTSSHTNQSESADAVKM